MPEEAVEVGGVKILGSLQEKISGVRKKNEH